jgi:hypothetical protein
MDVRSETAGHLVAPEPTSAGTCGLKLQLMWQRVDTRVAPCVDLELIYGYTVFKVSIGAPPIH